MRVITYSWEYPQLQLLCVSSRVDCVTLLALFYRTCSVPVVVWYPSDSDYSDEVQDTPRAYQLSVWG